LPPAADGASSAWTADEPPGLPRPAANRAAHASVASAGLSLRQPGPGGVALVGDAAEGVFDRQLVDFVGVVIVEPFRGFGVVRVVGIGGGVERLVEAGDAAAILGRRVALAGDVTWVGEIGVAGPDIGDGEAMLPAIAEVVEVIDHCPARPQHVAQADLAGVIERLGSQSSSEGRPYRRLAMVNSQR